tara:strand:- start:305 stop:481 length:177 start_codon:yes stop_codon:yes gene_type:complete
VILPDHTTHAWGLLMEAFPGSFGPDVFNRMSLEDYAEAYQLAIDFLQMKADAASSRHG